MSSTWRWRVTAIAMVIIAGASVGVLADRMLHREPAETTRPRSGAIWFDCAKQPTPPGEARAEIDAGRARRIADIQQELDLDPTQVEDLRATMERHGTLAHDFWDRTRIDYCQMRDQLRDDVRALLHEDQQPKFEQRLRRIDELDRERYNGRRSDGEPRRNKQR
jgi:uncharacterized membrane-anchored protein YhcB (DUF1043 family)